MFRSGRRSLDFSNNRCRREQPNTGLPAPEAGDAHPRGTVRGAREVEIGQRTSPPTRGCTGLQSPAEAGLLETVRLPILCASAMSKLFISHSSQDDAFVRELRAALADHGQAGWIDSRELRGGDPLWPEIQKAIEAASAFAVVVSTDALQSKWVGKELTPRAQGRRRARQGQVPRHPALAERHQARRAGGVLRRGTALHPRDQRRGRRRSGDECDPRRAGQTADPADVARHAAAQGRAAGGTRPRTHRPEVPGAGRRAPRHRPRPARL